MSNYWRADEDLDEDEQFLRDYVMNRQWLETDSLRLGALKEVFFLQKTAHIIDMHTSQPALHESSCSLKGNLLQRKMP